MPAGRIPLLPCNEDGIIKGRLCISKKCKVSERRKFRNVTQGRAILIWIYKSFYYLASSIREGGDFHYCYPQSDVVALKVLLRYFPTSK